VTFKPPCSGGEPDLNADILGGGILPGPYLKGVSRPLDLEDNARNKPCLAPLLSSPIT